MARGQSTEAFQEGDERALVEAAKLDPIRFAELYELNFDRVYAYVSRRVRDRPAAEDITSEVFHHALANLERFEWRGAPFVAWLYRIAANEIADRAVQRGREAANPGDVLADDDPEKAEELSRLFRLVRELPDDQRNVLEMRFVEGRSIREIAAGLNRSEGAVKQLQFRAVKSLRERMGGNYG
jgi:RNA polymerase sigma-70 factor (ECF subfamily)